jgi:hypothetical protein
MEYTFRGQKVDFGQPNQKGQGQTKEQWIAARIESGVFADTNATEAERKTALADVWSKLADEKKGAEVTAETTEVKK